jgi:hypothetical protein
VNQRVRDSENIYHDFPADLPLWRSPVTVLAANEIGSRFVRDQEIKNYVYGDRHVRVVPLGGNIPQGRPSSSY